MLSGEQKLMSSRSLGEGRFVEFTNKIKPKAVGKPRSSSREMGPEPSPEAGPCVGAVPSYHLLLAICLSTGSSVGNCHDHCGLGFCFLFPFSCCFSGGHILVSFSPAPLRKTSKG